MSRLLVEGGSRVHGAFLDGGLADRMALFIAPRILGDDAALPSPRAKVRCGSPTRSSLGAVSVRRLGGDVLVEGELPRPSGRTREAPCTLGETRG